MKKSTATNILSVCFIAVGITCLLFMIFAPQISAITNSPISIRMPSESLCLNLHGVTENNGYYNVSLIITNVIRSTRLDKFLVNSVSQENVAGLTIYLNGTSVNSAKPLNYDLKSGDILQVNLIVPSSNYASESMMGICVSTPQALFYTEATLS